jgi:SAM-dependent methyltransferase
LTRFAPARRRGYEILDDAGVDAETRRRSLADVARSNMLFGGWRAAVAAVDDLLVPGAELTLLDVGTGMGDIPAIIRKRGNERGAKVRETGLDEAPELLTHGRGFVGHAVAGTAPALPFRARSFDVVLCSQLLHHFADEDLSLVIRELDRVARRRVVIADLRRSRIAAAGFWLASFPLRFHPITRHDGVVSVFRGFTAGELRDAVARTTGVIPSVRHHLGFRLTATWTPA